MTVPSRPQQRRNRRDGAECVEIPLELVGHMTADLLDVLLHELPIEMPAGQAGGENAAERRPIAQRLYPFLGQRTRAGPLPCTSREILGNHPLALKRPQAFHDDRHRGDRAENDGRHQPSARFHELEHGLSVCRGRRRPNDNRAGSATTYAACGGSSGFMAVRAPGGRPEARCGTAPFAQESERGPPRHGGPPTCQYRRPTSRSRRAIRGSVPKGNATVTAPHRDVEYVAIPASTYRDTTSG